VRQKGEKLPDTIAPKSIPEVIPKLKMALPFLV
jgi:hypothetical protein